MARALNSSAVALVAVAMAAGAALAQAPKPASQTAAALLPVAAMRALPAPAGAGADTTPLLAVARAGQRLVAVGERGAVLLSDDDGRHWRQAQTVPVSLLLTGVSFANERHGWAVGHGGSILATADAGETWVVQRLHLDEDRPLFAVHFLDARRGVAVGLWSLVLVTDDGGATWVERPMPPSASGRKADLNLFDLFADGQGRLYATAERGQVLVSEDRGDSWSALDTGYKGSLWCGLALPGGVLLAGGQRGTLLRSEDGGRHWRTLETGGRSAITALAVGRDGIVAVGLDGFVARSADGGLSFRREQRPDTAALTALVPAADGSWVLLSRRGVLPDGVPRQ